MITSPSTATWNVRAADDNVIGAAIPEKDLPSKGRFDGPSQGKAKRFLEPIQDSISSIVTGGSGGSWQWYHWLIVIALLALLVWGGWYLYKKFR